MELGTTECNAMRLRNYFRWTWTIKTMDFFMVLLNKHHFIE